MFRLIMTCIGAASIAGAATAWCLKSPPQIITAAQSGGPAAKVAGASSKPGRHLVRFTVQQPQTDEEGAKRQTEALRIIAEAHDQFLTGDPNGRAEWKSANNETVTCGVVPQGRYIVI